MAAVRDLFFVVRIRETARQAGVAVRFARSPGELRAALADRPRLLLLDLTGGVDPGAVLDVLEATTPRPPVLGFTTHALAATTRPWHARCDRVVTKETLTHELPALLRGEAP